MQIINISPIKTQGYNLEETGELIYATIQYTIAELSAIFHHLKLIRESTFWYQDESFDYNFACKQYPIPDIDSDTYDEELDQQHYFINTFLHLILHYLEDQVQGSMPQDLSDHFILVNPTNNVTATININDDIISIYYHNPNQN